MSRKGQRWTPGEVIRLESMTHEGHTWAEVADALGRTVGAVKDKAYSSGLRREKSRARETVYEVVVKLKRKLGGCSPTLKEIMAETGMSQSGVYHHLGMLEREGRIKRVKDTGQAGLGIPGEVWMLASDPVMTRLEELYRLYYADQPDIVAIRDKLYELMIEYEKFACEVE